MMADGINVGNNLLPAWMQENPPASFSGKLAKYVQDRLFPDVTDKNLPLEFFITESSFVALLDHLREILSERFIAFVTVKEVNKYINSKQKKANRTAEQLELDLKKGREDRRISAGRAAQKILDQKQQHELDAANHIIHELTCGRIKDDVSELAINFDLKTISAPQLHQDTKKWVIFSDLHVKRLAIYVYVYIYTCV
jgi:hypothetical protein